MSDIDFDTTTLEKLIRTLESELPQVQVGILQDNPRVDGKSNSDIGMAHEFSAPGRNIPERSFLRVPINDKLPEYLEASGMFSEDVLKEVIKEGSTVPWLKAIAKIGKKIVLDAFDTGGFGKWIGHSPGYENETGSILKDTQQLKDNIDAKVTDGE